jgi:spore maturation protein CgeB
MMGEIVNAIRILEHELKTIIVEREAEVAQNDFIENLLRVLIQFRPDFVLTLNHLGFDREGIVTDLLTTLKIPFASWYVDSPTLIIKHYERNLSPYCIIFLWDEDYITDMQALGFDKVHYLPLAADPHIFRPIDPAENPLLSQANEISFVGNSMVNKIRQRINRLKIGAEHENMIEELGRIYAHSNCRNVSDILAQESYVDHPLVKQMQNGKRIDFETLIMWQATHIYRLQHVQMLEPFHPVIRGDDGWHSILNEGFRIGPELSYYHDLNFFYNVSDINFNITSTQMRNAVNQRVFDVPASCGFLLTDHKNQLEGLMKVGKEVVCYSDKEEIPELIRFYLKHETLRKKIAREGRKRVLMKHSYSHRLRELCSHMKGYFEES